MSGLGAGPVWPRDLLARWRARAALLRPYAPAAAHAVEAAAEELEQALDAEAAEPLTLTQAAALSGYSPDYLGRMVRDGRLPNAGRLHAPRLRRADVPRKAPGLRPVAPAPHLGGATPGDIARAVVTSQSEGRR
ncbi:MAG TPA: hypothetical protein VLW50_06355 [Streptosporangiaceae bacterium]|nr:hypothetical protein [Streptosporangiaceae bacterium]